MQPSSISILISPGDHLAHKISIQLEGARKAYNLALERKIAIHRSQGVKLGLDELYRFVEDLKSKPGHDYLNNVSSCVIREKLKDQQEAFARFFSGKGKFPAFLSMHKKQSIRYTLDSERVMYDGGNQVVYLSEIGRIGFQCDSLPEGEPVNVTISQSMSKRLYLGLNF